MSGAVRETTKYFDFEIPQFDFPGWHVYYDRNVKTIDTILYLMTGTDSLKGIWKNNELYEVGDRVVDIDVAFAYECFVEHTSAPAPTTFAQDRTAHPTYWHAIDFIQALSGSSSTPVTIGLGNQTFQTQTGRIFVPGAKIIVNSGANPTVDYMWGSVVSYTGNELIVDVDVISGSGTHSDWLLSVSGERGIVGPQGIQGEQGPIGFVGPQGPVGPTGPSGIIEEPAPDSATYGRTNNGTVGSWIVVAASNASTLPVTPSGNISSTNVQAALNELDAEKLAKSGDIMTGPLTLASDPVAALDAAPKQYVDSLANLKVNRAGDTMTGILNIDASSAVIRLDGSTISAVGFEQSNVPRWTLNGATDLSFVRFNDSGSPLGSALTISRATGNISIGNLNAGNITAGSAVFNNDIQVYRSAAPTTGVIIFSTTTGKYIYYDGTNFNLVGGGLLTGPINTQGNSITAGAIVGATLSLSGSATINGNINTNSIICTSINTQGYDIYTGTGRIYTSSMDISTLNVSSTLSANFIETTNFTCQGTIKSYTGYQCKAGTQGGFSNVFNLFWSGNSLDAYIDNSRVGTIAFQCDYRTKKNVADLPSKWDIVKALRPIQYSQQEYIPPGASLPLFNNDDREQWGFIAHELQATTISTAATGTKDAPDMVQSPNPWTIIAALTKALQEAMARIEALEAA
jgi:hypothetical protein